MERSIFFQPIFSIRKIDPKNDHIGTLCGYFLKNRLFPISNTTQKMHLIECKTLCCFSSVSHVSFVVNLWMAYPSPSMHQTPSTASKIFTNVSRQNVPFASCQSCLNLVSKKLCGWQRLTAAFTSNATNVRIAALSCRRKRKDEDVTLWMIMYYAKDVTLIEFNA